MMKNIYVYRDKAVGYYTAPIFSEISPDAYKENACRAAVKANDGEIAQIRDMALYRIGTFDDDKGVITGIEPEKLCDLEDYVRKIDTK